MGDYWEDNNIEKPQEIIVCAANLYKSGLILCGARHWDKIMISQADCIDKEHRMGIPEQGFINQFGEFKTRIEAMEIVKQNGQPFNKERNGGSGKELYSEGLY